jgi:hypothetical protein
MQIAFALVWAPKTGSFSENYLKLLNWDSDHYRSIAHGGYKIPDHPIVSDDIHEGLANVVFLPGYPLLSRWISEFLRIPIDAALLLAAQGSALVFWFYFFLFLEQGGVSRKSSLLSAFAVAVHPAAFYLVVGYTESLFLALMLGYLYWCERGQFFVAWLHGLFLSWTRIVGVAVAVYPVLRSGLKFSLRAWLVFLGSTTSLIGFFYFCQVHFQDWAIYFHLEETGWQNHRLYFAILNPLTYIPHFFFEDTIQSLNKFAVTFTAFLLITIAHREDRLWIRKGMRRTPVRVVELLSSRRGVLYLVSFGMFYIALTGKANSNLDSMLRYTFPCYVLFVIELAELNAARRLESASPVFFAGAGVGNRLARVKLALCVVGSLGFQAWCIYRFTHGHWVA